MRDDKDIESLLDKDALLKADEEVGIVEVVSWEAEDGGQYYGYISLFPSKYLEFKDNQSKGVVVDLVDYGEFLYKGVGNEPSEEVKREMEDKYGVNHNFMNEFHSEYERIKNAIEMD